MPSYSLLMLRCALDLGALEVPDAVASTSRREGGAGVVGDGSGPVIGRSRRTVVGERDGEFMVGVCEGDASAGAFAAEGADVTAELGKIGDVSETFGDGDSEHESAAVVVIALIRVRCSALMSRTPPTSRMNAAYIRAAARAVMVPG